MHTLIFIHSHKSLALLVLCLLAALGGGCGSSISDASIEFVTLADVQAGVQGKPGTVLLIDPRAPQDFVKGHIPAAMNLQLPDVPIRKDSLDPMFSRYKQLIVYGANPGSDVARAMTKRLLEAGAKDTRMFSGGYLEWTRAGLAVETGPGTPAPKAPRY